MSSNKAISLFSNTMTSNKLIGVFGYHANIMKDGSVEKLGSSQHLLAKRKCIRPGKKYAPGIVSLLRPLLLDVVPSIRQTAALALGRLADYDVELAEAIVKAGILPQLICSLPEENRYYKKAAAFVLRGIAKHSPQLAQAVVQCGALEMLVICLEDFDPGVKEGASWALGYIARHNAELSQAVVDAGAVPLLVLCIQEPEIALKRIAASTLSDISKHSPELAQTVVDAGAIAHLAQMILNPDAKLKRQVLSALSQIAKHSVDLAELMVEAEIFPVVLTCLKDSDEYVKKNGATLIREIAKHTPELSQFVVNSGGVAAVIDCIGSCKGTVRLPGIMTLGYVAAHSENLSMAVIVSKTKKALKNILQKCTYLPALEPLLHEAPHNIMKHVIGQFSKPYGPMDYMLSFSLAWPSPHLPPFIPSSLPAVLWTELRIGITQGAQNVLPHDSKARRLFVTSGGLKKVQEIKAEPGSLLQEYINTINNCYPEEIRAEVEQRAVCRREAAEAWSCVSPSLPRVLGSTPTPHNANQKLNFKRREKHHLLVTKSVKIFTMDSNSHKIMNHYLSPSPPKSVSINGRQHHS
ncbi:hypothetical protein IHE44_0000195 [Lamprotornis superbus]|uniref:Sperm-associated antigen 6 n=1 Tax=Lamprotornis superbus TaxID=245042 RepID=A0A835P3C9_9PASS|nr:hypothetical protein IHE44_0000195 [Lamprotornis superbus]